MFGVLAPWGFGEPGILFACIRAMRIGIFVALLARYPPMASISG